MVADIEELEEMDASELHARRLNAKEVLTPMKGDNFIFPVADENIQNLWVRTASEKIHLNLGASGTRRRQRNSKKLDECIFPVADGRIKTLGGDQDLRTSTLIRERPIRGESLLDFLGESEGSLPPPQDSFPDASEAINDFWSMSGNFRYRHHVETRSQTLLAERRIIPCSTEVHRR